MQKNNAQEYIEQLIYESKEFKEFRETIETIKKELMEFLEECDGLIEGHRIIENDGSKRDFDFNIYTAKTVRYEKKKLLRRLNTTLKFRFLADKNYYDSVAKRLSEAMLRMNFWKWQEKENGN